MLRYTTQQERKDTLPAGVKQLKCYQVFHQKPEARRKWYNIIKYEKKITRN